MPVSRMAEPIVSLSEAQAYLRVETGEEEALLAGLIRSASALCEAFLGQVLVARAFVEDAAAVSGWQRLATGPVRAIASVEKLGPDGVASPLTTGDYAVDVDASGDGWVRVKQSDGRVRVSGSAGLAADSNDVPEPIRHGVLRLVAHLYANRDGGGGEPPAAVTALWRPYRRMRLS